MRSLVTGAGGTLGRDTVEELARRGEDVTGLGHAGLDVTRPDAVERALRRHRPGLVVNCAAYKSGKTSGSSTQARRSPLAACRHSLRAVTRDATPRTTRRSARRTRPASRRTLPGRGARTGRTPSAPARRAMGSG